MPGLILFAVIGIGHAGAMMGLGLMIWIFVQVSMIGGGHLLQYLYFSLGVVEVLLSVLLLSEFR